MKSILIGFLFLCVLALSNYYAYEFGQQENRDYFFKQGLVKGRIDLLLELEKELGYKV